MARRTGFFSFHNLIKLTFIGLVAFIILVIGVFLYFAKDLPQPGKLTNRDISESTRIFDRNGKLLYDIYGNQDRTYVKLADVADYVRKGTIAVEDKEFYTHEGFSLSGYLRVLRDVVLYHTLTGGSTLTQQLIKNALLSPERTATRKIKEFILAIQVENKYTKDEILELYLNEAPYGGTTLGIEAAAQQYFGKHSKNLNLVESAILAGMPQSPTYYSPYTGDPQAYVDRASHVLDRMRDDGYITRAQTDDAKKQLPNVKFRPKNEAMQAPHFVLYVRKLLEDQFGANVVENGGLQVTTTLDLDLQNKAQDIVKDEVDNKSKGLHLTNGATIAMDSKTGEILALVGSKGFFDDKDNEGKEFAGQFNVATQGDRQPGSSIKPVTYATALKKGYTASTMIMDVKTVFPVDRQGDYIPVNYDGKFHGPVQMRFALGNSFNIPAVKMLAKVGIKDMLTTAQDLGLPSLAPSDSNMKRFGLSLTLGGGEVKLVDLVSAYAAFSNGGYKTQPISILKVTDSKGRVIFEKKPLNKQQVLDTGIAFIISHMLLDNNARLATFGPNSYLNISGKTVAVKTGTTDDKRDNWTVGWTPSYIVGVWVGNNDNSQMNQALASGITGAAPIWNRVFKEVLKGKKNEEFKVPDNVIAKEIDSLGGGLPVSGQATRTEYYVKGTEPQTPASIYQKLKISKSTGKIANAQEAASGNYDSRDYIVFAEDDPVSQDGKNRWQEGINAWLQDNYKDNALYHPPTDTSTAQSDQVVVSISTPSDHARVNDNDVSISASAVSNKQIVKISLFVDDKETKVWEKDSFNEKININDGSHRLKIKARDSDGREAEKSITIGVNANP